MLALRADDFRTTRSFTTEADRAEAFVAQAEAETEVLDKGRWKEAPAELKWCAEDIAEARTDLLTALLSQLLQTALDDMVHLSTKVGFQVNFAAYVNIHADGVCHFSLPGAYMIRRMGIYDCLAAASCLEDKLVEGVLDLVMSAAIGLSLTGVPELNEAIEDAKDMYPDWDVRYDLHDEWRCYMEEVIRGVAVRGL